MLCMELTTCDHPKDGERRSQFVTRLCHRSPLQPGTPLSRLTERGFPLVAQQ